MPIVFFITVGEIGTGLLERIHGLDGTWWQHKQFPILLVALILFYFQLKKEIQELKVVGFLLL